MPTNWNTTINLSPRTWRLRASTFGMRLVNVLFFFSSLLVILKNYAIKKVIAKSSTSSKRLIAQRMADMLFCLERNEIRDVENESHIKTLETNHANEGHVFRLEYHWE
ncbi:hypothetical protein Tco_0349345 [Tanacetum coccineum]